MLADVVQPRRVLLAAPRGFCAGVERAIASVEDALDRFGPPIYVRRQIVHNAQVVGDLERRGAVFVAETQEIPRGARLVLAAHGVAPQVYLEARERDLRVLDATCPLVTKTHRETRRFAAAGYTVVLIGDAAHDEVIGTRGQAPGHVIVVRHAADIDEITVPDEQRVAWVSQTTFIAADVAVIVERLRRRFPMLADPPSEDVCYAVSHRQAAVRTIAARSDLVVIVGAKNSHNSSNMVPVALSAGAGSAYLVESANDLLPGWLDGVMTVGLSSGASVPERLVREVLDWLAVRGFVEVEEVVSAVETQVFAKPRELT
ncbi:MAG TPA: 4-hydroxy-3-methylbut-2-enyl diphosphate reductase [Micromonosporaceae bacterium]